MPQWILDSLNNPSAITLVVMAIAILWAGSITQPLWVFGNTHRAMLTDLQERLKKSEAREDMWMKLALDGTDLGRRGKAAARQSIDRLQAIERGRTDDAHVTE